MAETTIHLLPPQVADQIAAGEVVERPASAVKELVENSIDAGCTRVVVRIERAGKARIEVEDDGCGMSAEDARLAVRRHATSKIRSLEDLHRIASHGFRGEALPSIASVSRFRMHTALPDAAEGIEVRVHGGREPEVLPAPPRRGTRVEVRDLFLNTPARLRFLRSDRTEEAHVLETMRGLALAHPEVAFTLFVDGRRQLDCPREDWQRRVARIMGEPFAANSVHQRIEHEGIVVEACLGLPTFHHRDSTRMHFLLNGRVIRDRGLIAALRAAYRDVMFHDRYPVAVVRIEMDPREVDVNVHPAKREVRFRKPTVVRASVVACVRAALERMGRQVSSEPGREALLRMRPSVPRGPRQAPATEAAGGPVSAIPRAAGARPPADVMRRLWRAPEVREPAAGYRTRPAPEQAPDAPDLGEPVAQLHGRYILAQTGEGIVLVDQHAAHERMTFEALKRELATDRVSSQPLLVPAEWTPDPATLAWLAEHADALARFGVRVSVEGERVRIEAVPAQLAGEAPVPLVEELVDSCRLIGLEAEADASGLGRVLERWLGNRACKASIRSGRTMTREEQEALLRGMERTPNIAQCNHGRPTYVRLSLDDLDRLFGRRE